MKGVELTRKDDPDPEKEEENANAIHLGEKVVGIMGKGARRWRATGKKPVEKAFRFFSQVFLGNSVLKSRLWPICSRCSSYGSAKSTHDFSRSQPFGIRDFRLGQVASQIWQKPCTRVEAIVTHCHRRSVWFDSGHACGSPQNEKTEILVEVLSMFRCGSGGVLVVAGEQIASFRSKFENWAIPLID